MSVYLDLLDRQQRALRVDNALRDGSRWAVLDKYDSNSWESSIPDMIEETTQRYFSSSAGMALFLKAALLIRKNYQCWIEYLNNIHGPPPAVFEPFAENHRLVIFLFMCDYFKVFRLDPCYPFLTADQRTSTKFFIRNDEFNSENKIKRVIDLWASMGFPEEVCETNHELLENDWKQLKEHPESYSEFPILELFLDMSESFGLERFIMVDGPDEEDFKDYILMFVKKRKKFMIIRFPDSISLTNDGNLEIDVRCFISFYRDEFVKDASIMLSFDFSNETLEAIHELFPQFLGIVSDICREYYLGAICTIAPFSKSDYKGKAVSMTENEMSLYQGVTKLIEKEMNCKIAYNSGAEETDICHKGVLNIVKKYPYLLAKWETDYDMAKHFRKLAGEYLHL